LSGKLTTFLFFRLLAHLRDVFFGKHGIHHLEAAQDALEPFQNKICNKHLIYIVLDLLLSKIVPEIYPDQ